MWDCVRYEATRAKNSCRDHVCAAVFRSVQPRHITRPWGSTEDFFNNADNEMSLCLNMSVKWKLVLWRTQNMSLMTPGKLHLDYKAHYTKQRTWIQYCRHSWGKLKIHQRWTSCSYSHAERFQTLTMLPSLEFLCSTRCTWNPNRTLTDLPSAELQDGPECHRRSQSHTGAERNTHGD